MAHSSKEWAIFLNIVYGLSILVIISAVVLRGLSALKSPNKLDWLILYR